MKTFKSNISQRNYPLSERISGKSVRESILKEILNDHPDFTPEGYLSVEEFNYYRKKHISETVGRQIRNMSDLEKKVISSLSNHTTLTDKIDDGEDNVSLTFGQKVADKVAFFGGSWIFILLFISFLLIWIAINAFLLGTRPYDPYPFILLNLLLSCLAALQAPVIMMSQNRQGDKDRERSKKDYMVNLKSELEIKSLHEKIDHLIIHQQQELMEVQNVQLELLNDILEEIDENRKSSKKKKEKQR